MAQMFIKDTTLTNIANAIREKTGGTAKIYPENMAGQIRGITSGGIDTTGIDQGVIDEANRVASSINNKKAANSITFIAMSDMHEMGDGDHSTQSIIDAYRLANAHAGQGAELIAKQVQPEFFANLGDLAWGIESYTVHDMAQSITNARVKTAGLERLTTCFATPGNHDIGYRAGSFDENLVKAMIGNYKYIDFDSKKVRVIVANTSDVSDGTDRVDGVSGEQLQWFANALDISSKTDASNWGILIFSHHPLDWNANTMPLANCVAAYVNGTTYSVTHDGISISKSYSGKNVAKIISTFHGHVHCYKVANLSTTTDANPVKRIAIPNACNGRNNEYGRDGNLTFGEPAADTCPSGNNRKSTIAGQDTAFCVVTIDLDEEVIYADCFGSLGDTAPGSHAGYDRVISYGVEAIVTYTIANSLSNVTTTNSTTSVVKDSSYSAIIKANSGYELSSIKVTMGGTDITASAVSGSNITIAKVTGDIVITAAAIVVDDFEYGEFTNLVPLSQEQSSTAVYNEVGYKNNTYPSEATDGSQDGVVCTGWIPYTWSSDNVLYVKGATLDTSNGKVRMMGFNTKTTVNSTVGYTYNTNWGNNVTIEQLGDQYYKITPKTTVTQVGYIRLSLVGTGEKLIVTINEPIHYVATDTPDIVNYTITNNLTFVTSSNSSVTAQEGSSYSATLTADTGYTLTGGTVTVTMGGTDITSSVYSGGNISISSVTGNIVITATAKKEEVSVNYTNVVPTSEAADSTSPYNGTGYKNGVYCSSSGGDSSDSTCVSTGYIPYSWTAGNSIYVKGAEVTSTSHVRIYGYNSKGATPNSSACCGGTNLESVYFDLEVLGDKYYKLTHKNSNNYVQYLRLSLIGTGENLIVTLNEPIE